MSHVDLGKFACAACNRTYPWKPEYAGRKVKCKCGAVLTAPTEPPASEPAEEEDDLLGGLYDLAAQEAQAARSGATTDSGPLCPSCQQEMPVGEAVCPHCSFNLRTKAKAAAPWASGAGAPAAAGGSGNPMLAYAGMNRRSAADARAANANAVGGSDLRELYIPSALVVAGLFAQLMLYGYVGGAWRGIEYALPGMGLALLINVVLSFVGVALVAKMFDLGFGAPGPAVLKMAAICLLPSAIAEFIGRIVGADSAFVRHMVPAILIIPLAEIMFVLLFDLAYDEAIYTAIIIYLVNDWAVIILLGVLMSGSFGGGGGGGASPTRAVVRADEAAAESVERPNATEARSWLGETVNHMYEGETHDSSQKLVTALYDAGAKRVTTLSSSGQGYALVVELPSKQEARAKVIAVIRQQEQAQKVPAEDQTEDQGQRYHTFEFGPG